MAELNPSLQPQGEAGFTGYSRGQIPNTAGAGLFQDASQGLQAGVRAATDIITQNIRNDVTATADEVRDTQIMRLGGPPENSTPEEIEAYRRNVEGLRQSRRAGVLSDSHYWAQLDVETRRIRQKYPGHRSTVDQIMQEVVGANPANRLVAELSEELRGRRNTEQQTYEHWLRVATKEGAASALNYATLVQQGRPPSLLQLQRETAVIQAREAERQAEQNSLALDAARGVRDTNRAVRGAQNDLYSRASQIYATATGPIQDFERRLANLRRNPNSNPADLQALRTMFDSQVRGPLINVLNETLHGRRPGQPEGTTWGTLISDQNQIQNITKTYTDFVNSLGEAVGNGDWSLFTRLKTNLEAYQRGDTLSLLNNQTHGQTFRHLQAVREILGPQFYANSEFINRMPQMQQALQEIFAQGAEDGLVNGRPLSETTTRDRRVTRPDQQGSLTAARIDTIVGDLSRSDIQERAITGYARQMFGPRNLDFLTQHVTNVPEVYQRITGDRRLHENMLRIQSTQPQLYSSYQEWVIKGFGDSLRNTAQSVRDATSFTGTGTEGSIVFNTSTNRFHFSGPASDTGTRSAVDNVNRAISGLSTFLEVQGRNPDEIRQIVSQRALSLNIDPNVVRQNGPFRTMFQQFQNFVAVNDPGPGGTREPVVGPLSAAGGQPEHYAPLLQRIQRGEAGQHGYTQVFGPNRLGAQNPELINMTMRDVRQLQRSIIGSQRQAGVSEDMRSSAVGAYQFTQETLDRAMQLAGISDTDVFDRRTQDRMATALLNQAGVNEYIRNPTEQNLRATVNRLSREWAALPNSMGVGSYDGVAGNRANVPLSEIRDLLKKLAEQHGR